MDVIDGNWIKARLTKRGEQAELARYLGLTPQKMSAVIKNDRRLTQQEAQGVLRFFGVKPADPEAEIETIRGFAESLAERYTPRIRSAEEAALGWVRGRARHPEFYRITRPAPALALLRHDLVIIDINLAPASGDLVLCSLGDAATGNVGTHVRRWLDPWLIEGDQAVKVDPADDTVAIRGPVVGLLRGPVFS